MALTTNIGTRPISISKKIYKSYYRAYFQIIFFYNFTKFVGALITKIVNHYEGYAPSTQIM